MVNISSSPSRRLATAEWAWSSLEAMALATRRPWRQSASLNARTSDPSPARGLWAGSHRGFAACVHLWVHDTLSGHSLSPGRMPSSHPGHTGSRSHSSARRPSWPRQQKAMRLSRIEVPSWVGVFGWTREHPPLASVRRGPPPNPEGSGLPPFDHRNPQWIAGMLCCSPGRTGLGRADP